MLSAAPRRRRPTATTAAPTARPPRRRASVWFVVGGLVVGLAAAHVVVTALPERFVARALIGLDADAATGLALDAELTGTRAFRRAVIDAVAPAVRVAAIVPAPAEALLAEAQTALATVATRIAGPSAAEDGAGATARTATAADLRLRATHHGEDALGLEAEARTAAAARRLAEAAAERLLEARLERRRAQLDRRLAAIEAAIADTRATIEKVEGRLAVADPQALAPARAALVTIEERLTAAETRRRALEAELAALSVAARPPRDLERLLDQPRSGDLQRAVQARDRAAARRLELAQTYGERHPVMLAATQTLAEREAEVAAAAAALVEATAVELEALKARAAALEAEHAQRLETLTARQADRAAHEALRTERDGARDRLASLAAERAELRAEAAALVANARLLGVSDAERRAVPAPAAVLYGIGATGGVLLGGLLALPRRREAPAPAPPPVASAAPVPILARLRTRHRRREHRRDDDIERLALRLEAEAPPRVLALAPVREGLDVARPALRLAEALTREGRAVLVVEATGAASVLPRSRRGREAPGLDAVLAGACRWRDAVEALAPGGPWLLPATTPPAADLDASALEPVLAEAARRFDRVVVAAPSVVDTTGLRVARAAGTVLLLVRAGSRDTRDRDAALAELEAIGARAFGIVLVA